MTFSYIQNFIMRMTVKSMKRFTAKITKSATASFYFQIRTLLLCCQFLVSNILISIAKAVKIMLNKA